MKEKSRIPATAVARMPQSPNGTKYATYRAKITDDAAMIPECALQNIAHPHRNPQPGESVSFRKTYTPPVRGKAHESSAHTSAPKSVRMPAATHTERTPPTLGTYRLISEGCTKIEAPMMMPATIAVACSRPMGRSKTGGFPGAVKMRQCTKKENRIFTAEAREGVRHRSGGEGSPNRSRDRKAALLALPIDLTLPYGRGSDWSTPYARIFSIGRHLRTALTYVSCTPRAGGPSIELNDVRNCEVAFSKPNV